MNTLIASAEFRAELPGWLLRGVLCAINSACWAVAAGFTHPLEIVGMALGVAVWVAAFAGFCGWARQSGRIAPGRMAEALKTAAWIKLLLVLLGLPAIFGRGMLPEGLMVLAVGLSVDMVLGIVSLQTVAWLTGMRDFQQIATLDSTILTMMTTLVEGALMATLIMGIAAMVLGWRWFAAGRVFTPIRKAD